MNFITTFILILMIYPLASTAFPIDFEHLGKFLFFPSMFPFQKDSTWSFCKGQSLHLQEIGSSLVRQPICYWQSLISQFLYKSSYSLNECTFYVLTLSFRHCSLHSFYSVAWRICLNSLTFGSLPSLSKSPSRSWQLQSVSLLPFHFLSLSPKQCCFINILPLCKYK